MSVLQFARIIDPVCSCGNYVGRFQPDIEFELLRLGNYGGRKTDDEDLAKIMDEMGITRICCRKTIMVSPVLRLIKPPPLFTNLTEPNPFSLDFEWIKIRKPNLDF